MILLTPALGRISLPPARHCLNPSVAVSVDSIVAVHATTPKRAENIAFNFQYQTLRLQCPFLDSNIPDQYGPRGF
jgi:hypothetical protein